MNAFASEEHAVQETNLIDENKDFLDVSPGYILVEAARKASQHFHHFTGHPAPYTVLGTFNQ